jgi:hypothetical protein
MNDNPTPAPDPYAQLRHLDGQAVILRVVTEVPDVETFADAGVFVEEQPPAILCLPALPDYDGEGAA